MRISLIFLVLLFVGCAGGSRGTGVRPFVEDINKDEGALEKCAFWTLGTNNKCETKKKGDR